MDMYSDLVATVTVDLSSKAVIADKDKLDQHAPEKLSGIASRDKEKRDMQIEAMIEIILELKKSQKFMRQNSNQNESCGLVLNSDMVSPESSFVRVGKILGKGNSAGEVILVRDKVTDKDFAYKTIMLAEFNADEIRAWVCLADEQMAPELYQFKLNGNKVGFSMEPLPGQTLQNVIDSGKIFNQSDPKVTESFALYALVNLLEINQKLSENQFLHRDMHGGNVMLEHSMEIKLIDFGRAKHLLSLSVDDKSQSMVNDIVGIIRIFCLLFSGVDFNGIYDVKKQLGAGNLSELSACMTHIPEASRKELFKIVNMLFDTIRDPRQEGFGDTSTVVAYAKKLLPDVMELKKKAAVIIFPEKYQIQTQGTYSQLIGQTGLDYTDGDRDNILIWDDPDMDVFVRCVTIKDIEKLDAAVSFF